MFDLDQIICVTGKKLAYDTIILQREPGVRRVVSEILDTRVRNISYSSICHPPSDINLYFKSLVATRNYPTVWYTSDKLLQI